MRRDDLWTQEEWRDAYPEYHGRYLAYCNAKRADPEAAGPEQNADYVSWIDKKLAQCPAEYKTQTGSIRQDQQLKFNAFLWGELEGLL